MSTHSTPGFARRNMGVLLLAALLGVVIAITTLVSSTNDRTLAVQQAQISQLEGELEAAKTVAGEKRDSNVLAALGVTASRVEADSSDISQLLQVAFNWDSGDKYDQARETLKRRWKFSEQDPFLADFMPPAAFNQSNDGKRFYYIDSTGLKSSLGSNGQVDVVSVQGTVYNYVVTASTEVSAPIDGKKGEQGLRITTGRKMLLYISIDGAGKIVSLSGIPASGLQKTA